MKTAEALQAMANGTRAISGFSHAKRRLELKLEVEKKIPGGCSYCGSEDDLELHGIDFKVPKLQGITKYRRALEVPDDYQWLCRPHGLMEARSPYERLRRMTGLEPLSDVGDYAALPEDVRTGAGPNGVTRVERARPLER